MIGSLAFNMFYDKNGQNFSALTFTVDTVVAKGLGSRTEKCQWVVAQRLPPLTSLICLFYVQNSA